MPYDGITAEDLARRCGLRQCICLRRVTSTMDIVHEMGAQGESETLVLADEQLGGRGRMGRKWSSPKGKGIWMGYLAKMDEAPTAGLLSLRVGLAVIETLLELDVSTKLKWPNDVMLGDHKVAGILCEAKGNDSWDWIAVGIGINVHGPVPADLRGVAASLDEAASDITRVAVLERLVPRLIGVSGEAKLTVAERALFESHDWLRGRQILEPVKGFASGVSAEGGLLVDTGSKMEKVLGGSVVAA